MSAHEPPFWVICALMALLSAGPASAYAEAQAQTETAQAVDAQSLFEEGNRLFVRAERARGARRVALLTEAYGAYRASLERAQNPNALFNTAVVLESLGRHAEAYAHYDQYIAHAEVDEAERAAAIARRDALAPHVALVTLVTEPPGAFVHVEGWAFPERPRTPVTLALPAGSHRLLLERPEHAPAEVRLVAVPGHHDTIHAVLTPLPVEPEPEPAEPIAPPEPAEPAEPPEVLDIEAPAPTAAIRETRRLGPWPHIALGVASAAALVSVGLTVRAFHLNDDYDAAAAAYRQSRSEADWAHADGLYHDVRRANHTADALFAVTGALAVTTVLLYVVGRPKADAPPRLELAPTATRGGAGLVAVMPFGGP
jgi:tetratricopeptide (TPR) repeat protein